MNKKNIKNSVTYLNLCTKNNCKVELLIKNFFKNQQYTVLSYLKELNNYVTITTDYPIDKPKLLKTLDPYRKFCDTILLIIIFDKKTVEINFPWNLTEFGITDIVCVDDLNQITDHLQIHFNHYIALNKLIINEDMKQLNSLQHSLNSSLN
jgi:hypothetical protein